MSTPYDYEGSSRQSGSQERSQGGDSLVSGNRSLTSWSRRYNSSRQGSHGGSRQSRVTPVDLDHEDIEVGVQHDEIQESLPSQPSPNHEEKSISGKGSRAHSIRSGSRGSRSWRERHNDNQDIRKEDIETGFHEDGFEGSLPSRSKYQEHHEEGSHSHLGGSRASRSCRGSRQGSRGVHSGAESGDKSSRQEVTGSFAGSSRSLSQPEGDRYESLKLRHDENNLKDAKKRATAMNRETSKATDLHDSFYDDSVGIRGEDGENDEAGAVINETGDGDENKGSFNSESEGVYSSQSKPSQQPSPFDNFEEHSHFSGGPSRGSRVDESVKKSEGESSKLGSQKSRSSRFSDKKAMQAHSIESGGSEGAKHPLGDSRGQREVTHTIESRSQEGGSHVSNVSHELKAEGPPKLSPDEENYLEDSKKSGSIHNQPDLDGDPDDTEEGSINKLDGFEDYEFQKDKTNQEGEGKFDDESDEESVPLADAQKEKWTSLIAALRKPGNVSDSESNSTTSEDVLSAQKLSDIDRYDKDALNAHLKDAEGNESTKVTNEEVFSETAPLVHQMKGTDPNERRVQETTFSFMMSSTPSKTPYIIALAVILFKTVFLSMLIAGVVTSPYTTAENPIGVPPSTTWPVMTTQFFAVLITALVQDDLVNGLVLWNEGFNVENKSDLVEEEKGMDSIAKTFGGVSRGKWRNVVIWQTFTGLLGLVATFLLIVTSSEVPRVLLNFSIALFIAQLSRTVFSLARKDLLGSLLEAEARKVSLASYRLHPSKKRSYGHSFFLMVSSLVLAGSWGYVIAQQRSGVYLPQALVLQLDDSNDAIDIGYLGGLYILHSNPLRYAKGSASLLYCQKISAWVISLSDSDRCGNPKALSSKLRSMDVNEAFQLEWFLFAKVNQGRRLRRIENVYLSRACSTNAECGGSLRGTCEKSLCACRDGFYGIRCEFEDGGTCPLVEVDEKTMSFRSSQEISPRYHLLRGDGGTIVQAYHHPVFLSNSSATEFDVMLYSGLRWVITKASELAGLDGGTKEDIINYFERTQFDATTSLRSVDQVSAPVRIDTVVDQPAPVNVPWFPDMSSMLFGQTDTRLICLACDNLNNPCQNEGECAIDSTCRCKNGATGGLCQVMPSGNGRCDPYFNNALHGFDGGDCCSSTCISSNEYSCGEVSNEMNDGSSFVGFPLCRDPVALGCESGDFCWSPGGRITDLLTSRSGASLHLSANGKTAVVSEPSLGTIRVFDKADRDWTQRGEVLVIDGSIDFGRNVALWTLPGGVVSRRSGKLPLLLAASFKHEEGTFVRIYSFGSGDTAWQKVCKDIEVDCRQLDCEVQSVSVGAEQDRGVLAVASSTGVVYVYEMYLGLSQCELKWTADGVTVRMSGDGNRLAVASFSDLSNRVDFGTFDVSSSLGLPVKLDYDTGDNLLSTSYRSFLANSNRVSKELPFALTYDGKKLNIANVGSGLSVSIDSLQFEGTTGLYVLKGSNDLGFEAAQLTERQLDSGLSTVLFSRYGTSVAVKGEGNIIRIFKYKERAQEPWEPIHPDFVATGLNDDFAVSETGAIASIKDNAVEDKVASRLCADEHVAVHIVVTLDSNPTEISWFVDLLQVEDEGIVYVNNTLAGCEHCYGQELSDTIVLEEVCIPSNLTQCLRLQLRTDEAFGPGAGIAGFVNGEELAAFDGSLGKSDFFVGDNATLSSNCAAKAALVEGPRSCGAGRSLFSAYLTLDGRPEDVEWTLQSINTGSELLKGGSYDSDQAFTTVADSRCVPSDSECLLFTITDSNGDGICCGSTLGYGDLTLYLDRSEVYNPNGRFNSAQQEIYMGRGCPPTAGPTLAPVVSSTVSPIFPTTAAPIGPSLPITEAPASPVVPPSLIDNEASTMPSVTEVSGPTLSLPTASPTLPILPPTIFTPPPAPTTPTDPANPTQSPFLIITTPPNRPTPEEVLQLSVVVQLDGNPEETGWSLTLNADQVVVTRADPGKYIIPNATITEFAQIELGESYLFCITDEQGDGIFNGVYSVNYEGWPLVLGDGNFGDEACHQIEITEGEWQELHDNARIGGVGRSW